MTTLPAVTPGEPICHLGQLPDRMQPANLARQRARQASLEERVVRELSTNLLVVEPQEANDEGCSPPEP
jgi:hypothetical protein